MRIRGFTADPRRRWKLKDAERTQRSLALILLERLTHALLLVPRMSPPIRVYRIGGAPALAIVMLTGVHGFFASAGLMRRHSRFSRSVGPVCVCAGPLTVILQFDIGLRRTPDLADPAVMKPTIYQSSIGCGPSTGG